MVFANTKFYILFRWKFKLCSLYFGWFFLLMSIYLFIFVFSWKKTTIQIIRPSMNDSDYSSLVYARFADPYITARPRANICDVLGNIMNIRAARQTFTELYYYNVFRVHISSFETKTTLIFGDFSPICIWITHARSLLFARVLEYVTHKQRSISK